MLYYVVTDRNPEETEMKKVLIGLALVLAAAAASGQERKLPQEYFVIGDFIEAGQKCERGVEVACAKRAELCPVVMQNDRTLSDFIRNEYPIRSKNGGMNIAARYTRTKRAC